MDIYEYADEKGQSKVLPILNDIFSGCTVTVEQHYADKSPIDLYVTVTNELSENKYAIECKDRQYNSTAFNEWMIEPRKYQRLLEAKEQGYIPLYFNTFSDNQYKVWDISKSYFKVDKFNCPISTVEDKGRKIQVRYLLNNNDAIYSGKFQP